MAKKLFLLVLTLALAAGLCGCEKGLEPMQLQAAPVSEETRQVLDLIDNELTCGGARPSPAQPPGRQSLQCGSPPVRQS